MFNATPLPNGEVNSKWGGRAGAHRPVPLETTINLLRVRSNKKSPANENRDTHQWKSESTQLFTGEVSRKKCREGGSRETEHPTMVRHLYLMEEWPLFHSERLASQRHEYG